MIPLPIAQPNAVQIGNSGFSFLDVDGKTYYYKYLDPIDSHTTGDHRARNLRIGRFAAHGVRTVDLARACGIEESTVWRIATKYKKDGEEAFYQPRSDKGSCSLDSQAIRQAEQMLAAGMSQREVARKLGIAISTFNLYCRQGLVTVPAGTKPAGSGYRSRRGKGSQSIDKQTARQAGRMLASGLSQRAVAGKLGIAASTFNHYCRQGLVTVPTTLPPATAVTTGNTGTTTEGQQPMARVDRSTREERDRQTPMGRATHNEVGRVMASMGGMGPVKPVFDKSLSAVKGGGVLAALPLLLREGLLSATGFLSLPRGYYGITSLLLFLAFMILARLRNPEKLRHLPPGEWGSLLGLDRCPEVKTVRSKIRLLAGDVKALRAWQNQLASQWMVDDPATSAILSVDGHVKVYTGRKGRLKKHFVAREKLCLPVSSSYWLNALGGKPFLCLTSPLDPGMVHMLEKEIVPALAELGILGPDAPDLLADSQAEPALTLVFDREGWSPDLFVRLARRGVAVVTWHKNFKGKDWDVDAFAKTDVELHGPASSHATTVDLAEKMIVLGKDGPGNKEAPRFRQIRRRMPDGRQMALVTTHFGMPMAEVASVLFSRWAQENFFKYMRDEFNLDALPVHALDDPDPDVEVVNPEWRRIDKEYKKINPRLGTIRNKMASHAKSQNPSAAKLDQLQQDLDTLVARRETLKEMRKVIPERVGVGELAGKDALDILPEGEKLLLDILRMVAYRAETAMMPVVMEAQGKARRARGVLKALLQADADIVPDHAKGELRVRILGTASDAGDKYMRGLLAELSATGTCFPETNLRMVYEICE